MRQQRCGYNPFLRDSCHTHDGYIIYHPTMDSSYIDVRGGWHDASDYLQYRHDIRNRRLSDAVCLSAEPPGFGDQYSASGDPGANGIPDILDEARWGLEWLLRMNPEPGMMFHQIADDRDHQGFRLPTEDTISYGKGLERPVYYCPGTPQGIFAHSNRTTGIASIAGKYASAFALGSGTCSVRSIPSFRAPPLKAQGKPTAFGKQHPGVCQTCPVPRALFL